MRPWAVAWQDALYGPAGFYRSALGPAGHFATSCHGPLGAVFAAGLVRLAERHRVGTIVDVGAGRGELLRHLSHVSEDAAPAARLRLVGIDVVDAPDSLPPQAEWLTSSGGGQVPDLSAYGPALVAANEWLDVVPCPVAERDAAGVLREVLVDLEGRERLGDPAGAAGTIGAPELAWLERWWPGDGRAGERFEIGLPRDRALAQLISATSSGLVVAIDYGHERADRPAGGTLTGYRDGTQVPPVPDGGSDLTAHVAVDSLPRDRLLTQREALRECGIGGGRPAYDTARRDPQGYLRELARAGSAAALTGAGLGDFWWAVTELPNEPAVHRIATAALVRDGRVLLAHRRPGRRYYPDCWDFVGGHIEPGETAMQAIRRECREEIGVEVETAIPIDVALNDPAIEAHSFLVTGWAGDASNRAPDEHDDLRWFSAAELPELTLADPAMLPGLVRLLTEP